MTIAPLNGPSDGTAPPDANARPLLPGQSGEAYTPNGLPALQPHGVDLKTLFSEDIKDPVERIKRVENAVVELRHDFDAVLPSIVRLVAVEQDMQDLTRQLGVLLQNEPQAIAAAPNGGVTATSLPPLGSTPSTTQPALGNAPNSTPSTPPSSSTLAPLAPLNGTPATTAPAPLTPPNNSSVLAPLTPLTGSDTAVPANAASTTLNSPSALPPLSSPASTTVGGGPLTATPVTSPPASATSAGAVPSAIAPLTPAAATVATGSAAPIASPQQQPPGATVPTAVVPAPLPVPSPDSNGKIGQGTSATGTVRDLRIGEHADTHTTRLVLDAASAVAYTADLDNAEHLLLIDLPGATWSGKMAETLSSSPLIASWSVTTNASGSHVVIQLKAPAKIVKQSTFPASGAEPFKIVIDLAKP